MTRVGRACAELAVLWTLPLLAAGSGPLVAAEPRLILSATAPVFEGGEVELAVEMRGALADQVVTFTVTVDGEAVDRFDARGPSARHRFGHPRLTAGIHEIGVRTGSEKAGVDVRVLPGWTIAAGVAVLASVSGLLLLAFRRLRRATAR